MIGREQSSRRSERPALASMTGVADVVKSIRGKASGQASVFTDALTQTLREHSQSLVAEQKTKAAGEIQHLGAAVRSAADLLHDQKSESLARYVDTAADGLDGVARYVEEMNFADVAREVEQFARRRPALLLGGMFIAGLGVARFIKAAQEPQQSRSRGRAAAQTNRKRSGGGRRSRKSRRSTKD